MGKHHQVPGNSFPGQGADFPVGIPGRLSSASAANQQWSCFRLTSKTKPHKEQLELEQTDLGEAGRGVRPGVIQALGQAVVMGTASPFTSGQLSQFSEGEA